MDDLFCLSARASVPVLQHTHTHTQSLLFTGWCMSFPNQQSGRGVKLTTHMHIVQTLKMSGLLSPRPLHNFSSVNKVPSYLSRVDHYWKIRPRKQRTGIGKYSFVNRSITDWNRLPERAIGTSNGKTNIFKTGFRKVKTSEGE